MHKVLASVIGLVLVVSCGMGTDKKTPKSQKDKTSYPEKIIMSENIEATKGQFSEHINNSTANIRRFAKKHGWEGISTEIYFDSIMVFSNKIDFDKAYNRLSGKNNKLSESECILMVERTLLCMSPEYAEEHSAFANEPKAYEKYITYTLAKALHYSIIYGDESIAGPYWFREAFALFAAGLYSNVEFEFSEESLVHIVNNPRTGQFRDYAMLIKYITKEKPIKSFVDIAGMDSFNDSVINVIKTSFEKQEK